MSIDKFRSWLARGIAKEGGQHKFAEKHNVSQAVVSLVVTGVREPSKDFAQALGWKKEVVYSKEKAK